MQMCDVVTGPRLVMKHRVGGQRPDRIDAFDTKELDGRMDAVLSSLPIVPSSPRHAGLSPAIARRGCSIPATPWINLGDAVSDQMLLLLAPSPRMIATGDGRRTGEHHAGTAFAASANGEIGQKFGVSREREAGLVKHRLGR